MIMNAHSFFAIFFVGIYIINNDGTTTIQVVYLRKIRFD